ncbi:MAG: sulfatase-like hydrolase/transferase, partial [Armatimonadota bacterium]|nr:sulfatase-like hydrolase/transferase [Armatimonadota bacterium]
MPSAGTLAEPQTEPWRGAPAAPPNILWICTDQQRFDTIHALGNPHVRTPNLDRLVARGVAFTRAYCTSPICTPSRASFLTGRYPRTTRARWNGNTEFPPDEVLVTRLLAEAGYDCGLVGKLHLAGAQKRVEPRTHDGYRVFQWSHHPAPDWPESDYIRWLCEKGETWQAHYHLPPPGARHAYAGMPAPLHQTTWCAEKAIQFLSEPRQGPWLMSV